MVAVFAPGAKFHIIQINAASRAPRCLKSKRMSTRLFGSCSDTGMGEKMSHVQVELAPESEAVPVKVVNDGWSDDDPAYAQNADGWPRILSRLKTLLETGKTFRPH